MSVLWSAISVDRDDVVDVGFICDGIIRDPVYVRSQELSLSREELK